MQLPHHLKVRLKYGREYRKPKPAPEPHSRIGNLVVLSFNDHKFKREKDLDGKDAKGTSKIPLPCANHVSDGRVLADQVIEKGVHTPNPHLACHAKNTLWFFDDSSNRDTHFTPETSQKVKGFNIRVSLPRYSLQHCTKAFVAFIHLSDITKLVSETRVRYTRTQGLEHPKSSLDPSAKTCSEHSLHDIDRTLVGLSKETVRRSSGSPREVIIKTASEGALRFKATENPCVGFSGFPTIIVTEGEPITSAMKMVTTHNELQNSLLEGLREEPKKLCLQTGVKVAVGPVTEELLK